ncbi:MAG: hypothetical protein E4G96_09130 [Chrysiogenales bacterium]|nr:MAG: hypothetical protein E4G96_09130 [Chrysiogenales bacterium]
MPKDGEFEERKQGQLLPFNVREIRSEHIIYRISPEPGIDNVYYLRVETRDSFALPMRLITYEAHAGRASWTRLFLGLFYGFIIIMVLYNAIICVSTRDRSYLFLVLYMAAFVIFIMAENGIAYQYLWPGYPWWGKRAVPFFVGLVAIFSALFARDFLRTKTNVPAIDRILFGFIGLGLLALLLALAVDYFIAIIFTVVLMVLYAPVLLLGAFLVWRSGYRPALFFLISWFALIAGDLIYGLKTFAILPETFMTKHGVLIGAAFQSVLLSIAMADRISMMTASLKRVSGSLEQKTEDLLKIFEKAETMSDDLFQVSMEQSEIVETFSLVAQNQAAHAEEMAASYEELTSSTESIDHSMSMLAREGERIREMSAILTDTQVEVKHTNDAVMESMKNIIHFTEKTDSDLTRMTEMMEIINVGGRAITDIISLINDISDKINLLSLNAAIEAARAGEHGRGFAVVADEIGKLATATSDNSKQIARQVEKISVDIGRGIEIANMTKQSTSDVAKLVNSINDQIDTVKTAMSRQEAAINQLVTQSDIIKEQSRVISVATGEQKNGMLEGALTIQNLANMANDIAVSNSKIHQFIRILNDKAGELKGLIQNLDESPSAQ